MPIAAIYDPYLDTLGGGERYCLTVAEILLDLGYKVDLFWSGDPSLIAKASERFSLKLNDLNLVPDIFHISPHNIFNQEGDLPQNISSAPILLPSSKFKDLIYKLKTTSKYDLFFFLSDGSIPFLFSKNNILHVQVPLANTDYSNKIDALKLRFIKQIVCNSNFTQKIFERNINRSCKLLYPPVDVDKFKPSVNKENIILTVGRFDNLLNAKKQEIMVEAFKKLTSDQFKNWKLVLAGASHQEPENNHYLQLLIKLAQGSAIEFAVNQSFSVLQQLYSKSKIYWHAAGFGVDELQSPQKTEHFGIAVVEAMASGAVPIVISKGGLPEIIEDGHNGFLWNTVEELIIKSKSLMTDAKLQNTLSQVAILDANKYSKDVFRRNFLSILNL